MRTASLFGLLFLAVQSTFAQRLNDFSICCCMYQGGKLNFKVVNNSDYVMHFSFENIEISTNVVKYYRIQKDTIIIEFLNDTNSSNVAASGKISYEIDRELYFQRRINPTDTLQLSVIVKKKLYNAINYIKITLPESKKEIIYKK